MSNDAETRERPLSYWTAVARMPFEEDIFRLSGRSLSLPQNPTLEKMTALARSVGGIVQVRVIRDGSEVTRIVDYETAAALDDRAAGSMSPQSPASPHWTPTVENVNALPAGLRDYIHALETRCDPAGDLRSRRVAEDAVAALEAEIHELRRQLGRLAEPEAIGDPT